MSEWVREVRYSVRRLMNEPRMLVVAVTSLALGIGVSIAVVAVAQAVLLKPLPVPRPSELRLVLWSAERGVNSINQINSGDTRDPQTGKFLKTSFSYPAFTALQAAAGDRAAVVGFTTLRQVNLSVEGQPAAAGGMLVSGNFFEGVRVPLALGRGLGEDDDRNGAPPVAVLTHRLWQRHYGGDRTALGRTIRINGQPFTIVGVTVPEYFGVSNGGFVPPADVTIPLSAQPLVSPRWTSRGASLFTDDSTFWIRILARVATRDREEALHQRLGVTFGTHASVTLLERPEILLRSGAHGLDSLRATFERPLSILGGVAAIVFVLACLNTAGLVLVRSVARQRELWVRLALGASRARLVGQAAIDSLLLSIAGGISALVIGVAGARWFTAMLAGPQPNAIRVDADLSLIVTAAAIAGGATLVSGLLPIVRMARVSTATDFLRSSGVASQTPRLRAGRALIAAQIALSVPLVIGAVLLLRTVHNLTNVDLGFAPENLVMFRLDPSLNGKDAGESKRMLAQIVQRLDDTPGIREATLVENALLSGSVSNTSMTVDGPERKRVLVNRVGPGFFETMGVPLVAGRGLTWQDRVGARMVGVLNEAAVREYFKNASPLGQHAQMPALFSREPIEIVGVARDTAYTSLRTDTRPTIFLALLQAPDLRAANVVVRADATPSTMERIKSTVAEVDPDVAITDLKTQAAQIDESIRTERMFRTLLVFFGAVALLLACVGLHGVTSYTVARRTSEIGVRVALGAGRRDVIWLILRQAVLLAVVGLAIGIPAAIFGTRLLQSMLFGVGPADPWSLAAGVAIIFTITLLSGFSPARRAATLDPLTALRTE